MANSQAEPDNIANLLPSLHEDEKKDESDIRDYKVANPLSDGSVSDELLVIEAKRKLYLLEMEAVKARSDRADAIFQLLFIILVVSFLFFIVAMAVSQNKGALLFSEETAQVINNFVNAIALSVVPLLTGMLGAVTRLMMSGAKPSKEVTIIVGSGLMASFSWIGIKSGILAALLAPHLEKSNLASVDLVRAPDNFYTLLLVAVFVGMFSTNLYLMINHRVEQLAKAASKKEEAPSTTGNTQSATRR